MFARVHSEDVEMVAALGYRFATREGPYDIIYRMRIKAFEDYRTLHVVEKHQTLENGVHLLHLVYMDITDTPNNLFRTKETANRNTTSAGRMNRPAVL